MDRLRDLTVASAALDSTALVSYIEFFGQSAEGWLFPAQQSAEYAAICGTPSCCLICTHANQPKSALHFTSSKSGGLYMPNIVPLVKNALSASEYNGLASRFARDFRAKARQDGVAVRVALSKAKLKLRDVVSGKVAWKLFSNYINAFPHSHHPADVGRLDKFICALSRYSRRYFDVETFEYLLREELKWPADEATRCRKRVEIGLEVLDANRRF